MTSFYERITDKVTLPGVIGVALVAIPSYIVFKECVAPKVAVKYHNVVDTYSTVAPTKEEDILEAKVKSENLRAGPAFIYSHVYHNRRTERVKSAYTSVWSLVNQNLDSGNRVFKVAVTDNDVKILNVVRRLLLDELEQDGYSASVTIHQMDNNTVKIQQVNSEDETAQPAEYYLDVAIL